MKKILFPNKSETYKPVTHVIFDLDGTILDTENVYRDAISSIAADYGKVYAEETIQKVTGSIERDTASIAIQDLELPLTIDEFLEKFRKATSNILPNVPFMPGAEKFIMHLVKYQIPIAIATSSPEEAVMLKISNKKHIFDLFHHIVCGSTDPEVKLGKPAPDTFLVCASRFSANPKPEECLVLEDSLNGVLGAVSAGMQVIVIPSSKSAWKESYWRLATLRIKSMENFRPELFGLPSFKDYYGKNEEERQSSAKLASNHTVSDQPSSIEPDAISKTKIKDE